MSRKASLVYEGHRRDGQAIVTRGVYRERLLPDRSQMFMCCSEDFEWGYLGSGPAQLAFALLLDYYNDEHIARAHYQDFKTDVVAKLDDSWTLCGREIEEFVDENEKTLMGAEASPEVSSVEEPV